MAKSILTAFFTILIALSLFSCAGGPPPGPSSPDDCLVVIKTDFILGKGVDATHQSARQYALELSGGYGHISMQSGYSTAVVHEPAVRVTAITSVLPGNYIGGASNDPIKGNVILPYKPGSFVVADFVFVKRIEKDQTRENSLIDYQGFRLITESERAEHIERLKADLASGTWQ